MIGAQIAPHRWAVDLLTTIPGVSAAVARVIVAEIGVDMARFPTAGNLASWAGTTPGSNESAGKVKSTRTRPGNAHLKGALGIAALAAAKTKDTYLAGRFKRVTARHGGMKAIVAVERSMLTAGWHMLSNNQPYQDPGGDFHLRRRPDRAQAKALGTLRSLGHKVDLTPIPAA
ncbi:MAG: transposase [Bifidobacteriaceae bacterium]|nr:transposase [Bifidobacteriaceae bacterium]